MTSVDLTDDDLAGLAALDQALALHETNVSRLASGAGPEGASRRLNQQWRGNKSSGSGYSEIQAPAMVKEIPPVDPGAKARQRAREQADSVDETGLPRIDAEEARVWVYPSNMSRRDYQFNIVKRCLFSNTMVSLPTGLGKTFIAAVVMYNYYRWFPTGKLVFMAPTKPLVAQQIQACANIVGLPRRDIAELTGNRSPDSRRPVWHEKRVFFVTPQILVNDMLRGTFPGSSVVCLVIDEAHRGTGGHAYCRVVEAISKLTTRVRIVALSATPGNNADMMQSLLSDLHLSSIEYREDSDIDVMQYTHAKSMNVERIPMVASHSSAQRALAKVIEIPLQQLVSKQLFWSSNAMETSRFMMIRARDRFRANQPADMRDYERIMAEVNFGLAMTLSHSMDLLTRQGLKPAKTSLRKFEEEAKAMRKKSRLALMRRPEWAALHAAFVDAEAGDDKSHPKLLRAQALVVEHFQSYAKPGDDPAMPFQHTRVIVFAQFRESVNDIVRVLNAKTRVKAMAFVGQANTAAGKGLTQREQVELLSRFRQGGYNVVVATSIGEEGLDIGDVDLIICYDATTSPTRMVQRIGRTGRKRDGRVVVLVAEGAESDAYDKMMKTRKGVRAMVNRVTRTLTRHPMDRPMFPPHITPMPVTRNLAAATTSSSDAGVAATTNTDVAAATASTSPSSDAVAAEAAAAAVVPSVDPRSSRGRKRKAAASADVWRLQPHQLQYLHTRGFDPQRKVVVPAATAVFKPSGPEPTPVFTFAHGARSIALDALAAFTRDLVAGAEHVVGFLDKVFPPAPPQPPSPSPDTSIATVPAPEAAGSVSPLRKRRRDAIGVLAPPPRRHRPALSDDEDFTTQASLRAASLPAVLSIPACAGDDDADDDDIPAVDVMFPSLTPPPRTASCGVEDDAHVAFSSQDTGVPAPPPLHSLLPDLDTADLVFDDVDEDDFVSDGDSVDACLISVSEPRPVSDCDALGAAALPVVASTSAAAVSSTTTAAAVSSASAAAPAASSAVVDASPATAACAGLLDGLVPEDFADDDVHDVLTEVALATDPADTNAILDVAMSTSPCAQADTPQPVSPMTVSPPTSSGAPVRTRRARPAARVLESPQSPLTSSGAPVDRRRALRAARPIALVPEGPGSDTRPTKRLKRVSATAALDTPISSCKAVRKKRKRLRRGDAVDGEDSDAQFATPSSAQQPRRNVRQRVSLSERKQLQREARRFLDQEAELSECDGLASQGRDDDGSVLDSQDSLHQFLARESQASPESDPAVRHRVYLQSLMQSQASPGQAAGGRGFMARRFRQIIDAAAQCADDSDDIICTEGESEDSDDDEDDVSEASVVLAEVDSEDEFADTPPRAHSRRSRCTESTPVASCPDAAATAESTDVIVSCSTPSGRASAATRVVDLVTPPRPLQADPRARVPVSPLAVPPRNSATRVVIAAAKELSRGIAPVLRSMFGVSLHVRSLPVAHYIISKRAGVLTLRHADLTSAGASADRLVALQSTITAMRASFEVVFVLLEADPPPKSTVTPRGVAVPRSVCAVPPRALPALAAVMHYTDIHVLHTHSVQHSATLLHALVAAEEFVGAGLDLVPMEEQASRHPTLREVDAALTLLCCVPSIHYATAVDMLRRFRTLRAIFLLDVQTLAQEVPFVSTSRAEAIVLHLQHSVR